MQYGYVTGLKTNKNLKRVLYVILRQVLRIMLQALVKELRRFVVAGHACVYLCVCVYANDPYTSLAACAHAFQHACLLVVLQHIVLSSHVVAVSCTFAFVYVAAWMCVYIVSWKLQTLRGAADPTMNPGPLTCVF